MHSCSWQGKANSEQELMDKVSDHVAKKHAVHTMSDTIANLVKQKVKQT